MAQNPTVLAIQARIDGLQGLNQLKSALRNIGQQAKSTDNDLTGLVDEVVQFAKATGNSINSLEAQKGAFEQLKGSVEINGEQFKRAQQEIKRIDQALDEARGTVVSYSKNSISALRAQKQELLAVRDAADLMSKEFKDASIELSKLDKKLAKAEGRRGAGGRLRAGAQIIGTAAGAGVFGGPEGAIGALGGGIIGGPGGAILGAAVGAQIGQLRKASGEVAEYVAELNLAKATLAGVSKDQVEYNKNLEFAREISKNYAIRLIDVVKGYSSVTAAAKANNLSVKQTQSIYEGITASGIAFGKSQEDIQALFLATTQVLSKGKASAEEISGQIGERIPGAVAKFAAATERTLPQLAEAFQKGEVTISDFVKFASAQGDEYAEFAQSLAEGPEKAGLRLQIALDDAKEAFGGFFASTGAGFQDYLTNLVDFVVKNEDQFKLLIAKAVIFAQDFVEVFVGIAKGISRVFGPLFKAIGETLINLTKGVSDLFRQGQIETKAIDKLGFGRTQQIRREAEREIIQEEGGRDRRDFAQNERITKRYFENLAEEAGLSVPTDRANRIAEILRRFEEFKPQQFAGPTPDRAGLTGEQRTPDTPTPTSGRTPDPLVALRRQQAQEFRGFEASFADVARLKLKQATADLTVRILNAEKQGNKEAAFGLKQDLERERLRLNIEGLSVQAIERERIISKAKAKGIDVSSQEIKLEKDKTTLQVVNLEYEKLLAQQDKDRLEFNKQITKDIEGQKVALEQEITNRRRDLGLISDEDFTQIQLDRERSRLQQRFPDQPELQAEAFDLFRQQIAPTPFEEISQKIRDLKTELEDLVNPITLISNTASSIGDAFSQSFTDAITGSKSAKEALADFFRSVGSFFLDLAKQVIAQLIQIAILNAVTGLLPGLKGGGGGGLGGGGGFLQGVNNPLNIADSSGFNLGGFFADGGRPPINRPSIVGEKGPELFIPDTAGTVIKNELTQKVLKGEKNIQEAPPATSTTENTIQKILPASVNLEKAIQQLIPGFAKGGRPQTGRVSIVGEDGPELFVPDLAKPVVFNDLAKSFISNDDFKVPLDSSNLQFFADGGRPPIDKLSIVGERGPELFVPDVAGTIINNQSSKKIIEKATVIQQISKNQFADGGRPPLSQVSLVGERGPELFIPDSSSPVFSNENLIPFQRGAIESSEESLGQAMGSRSTVSERSSSSRFRETREVMVPFTRSAEQLSVASAERETAQAISNPEPLDVRFESQVINNVEYVTADQYRRGMSQAAERGRALTLEALQNSVKARKRIGL